MSLSKKWPQATSLRRMQPDCAHGADTMVSAPHTCGLRGVIPEAHVPGND